MGREFRVVISPGITTTKQTIEVRNRGGEQYEGKIPLRQESGRRGKLQYQAKRMNEKKLPGSGDKRQNER